MSIESLNQKKTLPYSNAVLVLGIISIPTCFCFGIVGLTCGIIALVLSKKGLDIFEENPELYKPSSVGNLKAGKICAIIGTCTSGLYVLYIASILAIYGTAAFTMLNILAAQQQ